MLVPLAPFAFTGSVLGWFALYYALQSAFLHANLRVSLGRFRGLYATPDFHRWHHSDFPEARDRNFVSIFPWIDRLFGTEFRATESARSFGTDAAAPSCITQIAYCLVPRQRVSGRAKA
jgi:sterol desaturase/sphingolipid hydroxylase (fatty acid hydroxylase superfamily)